MSATCNPGHAEIDPRRPARRRTDLRDHGQRVRQFTITNSNHPHHTVQTRALHAYLRWHNANGRHRDVLAAERKGRKGRTRIRSEKGIHWGGRPLKTAA